MKYYESTFEDYINAISKKNIHPDLLNIINYTSNEIQKTKNLIFYGPSGVGKYSQILLFLKKFSPSKLKYENRILATTEKNEYKYKISDIHYEIDMSLLGCNSKIIWHEIFCQIIDIVSMKTNKFGFIVCKNFHLIHSELLEIFYSYIQQINYSSANICIKFIIVTEHISFLPNKILNVCNIIDVKKPNQSQYLNFNSQQIQKNEIKYTNELIKNRISKNKNYINTNVNKLIKNSDLTKISNLKDIKYFDLLFLKSKKIRDLPINSFDIICNKIIDIIIKKNEIDFMELRNHLYDMLTYNLDIIECIWYILKNLITLDLLDKKNISCIINDLYSQLKYYNNNYRPIYHLEIIIYNIITKLK
tara:strand:- start:285 stop:1367 length:1083 start_codon:yes stop_codon:yes gene_type:complete